MAGSAQNLNKISVEIFKDGSSVDTQEFTSFTPATSIDETVTLNTAGLGLGIHSFVVSVENENGLKSIHASGTFLVEELITSDADIVALEYFVDTDPGEGMGTAIGITPSSTISIVETLNTSGLGSGYHTLYLRAQDETGKWGAYVTYALYIDATVGFNDVVQIDELEYFVDTDPGAGLGTPISVALSSNISTVESLTTSGLSAGFHTVFLRGKIQGGAWGPYLSQTIFVEPAVGFNDIVVIDELEYFVDTDPGAGLGTPISTAPSSDISLVESLNLSGLSVGFHTVSLRGKLQGGAWGPSTTTTIYVEPNVGVGDVVIIDALEYFVDTDPGAGLATPITVSAAANITSSETLATSGLQAGFHTLYLRGKLQNGTWGPYSSQTIFVEKGDQSTPDQIIEVEYFFDADPGVGGAITASATLPAAMIDELVSINTAGLSVGTHTVSLRAKEASGAWGPYFTETIEIDAATPAVTVFTPNGGETLTEGDSYEITWSNVGFPTTDLIEIRLSTDGGSNYSIIDDGTFATYSGSYSWTVPNNPGTTNLIQIANTTLGVSDESDAVFTIEDAMIPSITVVTPNGGENLTVGDSYEITWTDENIPGTDLIEIRLSTDGGSNYSILNDGTFSMYSGSYSWTVPNNAGSNNLIQIANTTQAVTDESDAVFTISAVATPSITVVTPNGGESLTVGDSYEITWTDENIPGTDLIEIRLSTDGGSNYSILNDGTFSMYSGSYSWTVPNNAGSNNLIQIANTTQAVTDESDAVFTISAVATPSITVVTPNGGESLTVGDSYEITWTDENIPGTDLIEIRLSTDGGSNYSILNDGTFSMYSGSYSWTVPDNEGDNNLIQIANTTQAIADESDGTFDIVPDLSPPVAMAASSITSSSFTASWSDRSAVAYFFDLATDPAFDNIVVGYDDLNVGVSTSIAITDLDFGQSYFYRVRADFGSELSTNSNVVATKTLIDAGTTADSTALRQIYSALGGASWSTQVNWTQERFKNWEQVSFNSAGNRIETVDLSSIGATGAMPNPFTSGAVGGLSVITEFDLSDNEITGLMDFGSTSISTLDVSGNNLQFDELEGIAGISNVNYANQVDLLFDGLDGEPVKIFHLGDPGLDITIGGSANSYTWFRNDQPISTGTEFNINDNSLEILDIDFNNMGEFRAEVTNSLVPGLTIHVGPQIIWATANLNVDVVDFDDVLLSSNVSAYLLLVQPSGGYDTLADGRLENVASQFTFAEIVLGDYLIAIEPSDQEAYIASYFGNTFLWEDAEVLTLRADNNVQIKMTEVPRELTAADGEGTLDVFIEEDFGDDAGRIDARRRAAKRKCGLRRKRSGGRTGQDDDEFELIAYGETDDNGEFQFGFLPQGIYRFFVEYPGIPLNDASSVEFEVGEAGVSDTDFKLQAFATEDGIEVTIEAVLGVILEYFKELEIYPNPSNEYLNIRYRHLKSKNVTAQLIDLTGNTMWAQNLRNGFEGQLQIDVTDFEEGIYILRFYDRESSGDNVVSFRVIVRE